MVPVPPLPESSRGHERPSPGALRRAARLYETHGLRGVVNAALLRIPLIGRTVRWWLGDHPWLGTWIERRGDIVRVDDCTFSLDAPGLSRALKSRFILGRYEKDERTVLLRFLDASLPVVELGGALGVIACLTNKRLARPEAHIVVEPNRDLLPVLQRNRELNRCRFTIRHGALAYGTKEVGFFAGEDLISARVGPRPGSTTVVPAFRLADLARDSGFALCSLICDIEGAEVQLVEEEGDFLARHVARIMMEVHPLVTGHEATERMLRRLVQLGFREVKKSGYVRVLARDGLEQGARSLKSQP